MNNIVCEKPDTKNGPSYTLPRKLTYDYFCEFMDWPWYINGVYLDDVEDIHSLYKTMMLQTESIEGMVKVVSQFGWLAHDAYNVIRRFGSEKNFKRLKKMIEKGIAGEQMAPLVLPSIMLRAYLISSEFDIPQFPAACQYVAARLKLAETKK